MRLKLAAKTRPNAVGFGVIEVIMFSWGAGPEHLIF